MLENRFLLLGLTFFLALKPCFSRAPYATRISCGARDDVRSSPANTFWYRDFAYTGGIPGNATRPSFITPMLSTLRIFPLTEGPENCYNINRIPHGHYLVRIFFGLVLEPSFDDEPLFDVSVEGTLAYSLQSGWSNHDDERAFFEALIFLKDGTASLCFHSTGHGDPAILAIEILQIDNRAYYFGKGYGQGMIFRTDRRLSCGAQGPKYGVDYSADSWGGDRFWNSIPTFGQGSDRVISTKNTIKETSQSPNFYPEALYQTALISIDSQPDLAYTMDVEPTRNYSLWLHFAEIDPSVTGAGQRVFDVLLNGDVVFQDVDIYARAGDIDSALVLNTTVAVSGRTLTITLHPTKGTHAIINAIELFELVLAESKTLPDEIRTLQKLKSALGLPLRFGWNGDPCVPQQHPWSGVDCQYDRTLKKHNRGLDNQGLRGFLPSDISRLQHLQSINLSGNGITGPIPASLGTITSMETVDLSFNFFDGSIPENLGRLTSLRLLNLNSNSLKGKVPDTLAGRLLHGASFNFTDNAGLCGIPGLPTCGTHLSAGAEVGIGIGACLAFLLIVTGSVCWWKRWQNILQTPRMAARDAPYAKARTQFNRLQMSRQSSHENNSRAATEEEPSLLCLINPSASRFDVINTS
ncbi:receptor-like protein 4 isoform X2 [Henckelia pumila]|uniref:receptor-like protein 4 isoform X2 n=1 Tax=Henckelia pumila TaxID=405737 RepID=UPI003C6DEE46